MRTSKKIVSLILAVMMVVTMMSVMAVSASAAGDVAEINGTKYESLEAAFAAAVDGDTITVLANCEGNGMIAPQGKFNNAGLTVDFCGYTYTVSGTPVGSKGTETSAFQLLKDNKITFKNGTITADQRVNPRGENSDKYLLRMIQNYSDLTLDGMTVSMIGYYLDQTTMATANGTTVIKNSTISAPDFSWGYSSAYTPSDFGCAALNEGTFSSYQSVAVTVTGNSVINGDVKIDDKNNKPFTLNLEGGTINGGITLDDNAQAAIDDPSVGASIDKGQNFKVYVAKIGDTPYESLEAAFAAAQDGDTIHVIGDSAGNGIKAPQGKFNTNGLKVDFHEHTYTMDGTMVGSTGTETQAFQLLKDNKITFGYGTLYSAKAKMLVQNYSNLTLNSMTLTLNNSSYTGAYTLSNNNGDVVINATTINANPAGGVAFDVCRYASYPSVNVEVKGDSTINGDVEVDAGKGDAKDGFSLTLTSGTLNGNINLTEGAKKAIDATPEKAEVTKKASFAQDAPAGYEWVAEGNSQVLKRAIDDQAWIKGFDNKISEPAVRIWTNIDRAYLDANASDYGYVVAKVSGKEQDNANFANLKANGGNGEKTISCKGTYNEGVGHNHTKDITLKVTGMEDGNQVAARFYYVINGVTYYADYVSVQTYDGIIASYTV